MPLASISFSFCSISLVVSLQVLGKTVSEVQHFQVNYERGYLKYDLLLYSIWSKYTWSQLQRTPTHPRDQFLCSLTLKVMESKQVTGLSNI